MSTRLNLPKSPEEKALPNKIHLLSDKQTSLHVLFFVNWCRKLKKKYIKTKREKH